MALQSCLYHGSITHLKCSYGLAIQMSVTVTTSGRGQHMAWSFLSDRGLLPKTLLYLRRQGDVYITYLIDKIYILYINEALRAYARGILNFFGGIRRSTLLRSPSFGGSTLCIHPRPDGRGLMRRRINQGLTPIRNFFPCEVPLKP